jgi:Rps23 Pro-64 3,4-dihydroxylase Tpa1-like proline 4-hydroxylase
MIKTKDLIYVKDNVLDKSFCKHLIEKFEKDDRIHPGVIDRDSTVDLSIKKTTDLHISRYDEWKEEDKILFDSLNSNLDEYFFKLISLNSSLGIPGEDNYRDTGYMIKRYFPDDYYNWHHDHAIDDCKFRVLTFIWYLNDVKKGGHTEFIDGTKIKPKCGRLLFFPSTWTLVHRGVSPINQNKYICTGWLYGY